MRNVDPAFGSKGILITSAASKSDDDGAMFGFLIIASVARKNAVRKKMLGQERRGQLYEIAAAGGQRDSGLGTRGSRREHTEVASQSSVQQPSAAGI